LPFGAGGGRQLIEQKESILVLNQRTEVMTLSVSDFDAGEDVSSVWTSLLASVTGGVIAIVGAVTGLRLQAKQAAKVREEQYAREDKYRLYEKRQAAYADLYLRVGKNRKALAILSRNPDSEEALDDARTARNNYWEAFAVVRLIGSEEMANLSEEFLEYIDEKRRTRQFDSDEYRAWVSRLTNTARQELR
jgi:hypothetical protein